MNRSPSLTRSLVVSLCAIIANAVVFSLVVFGCGALYGDVVLAPDAGATTDAGVPATTLWTLGTPDEQSTEFAADPTGLSSNYTVSKRTPSSFRDLPRGLRAVKNPALAITFTLGQVPPFGAEFRCKILDADIAVPQMAVFSNDLMVGVIQIAGVHGVSKYPFFKVYRLYIPAEFLHPGDNTLTLKTQRSLYGTPTEDPFLWWEWDYLQLAAYDAPVSEPMHGRMIRLGTNMDGHYYDVNTIHHLPYLLEWLGIAYSHNTLRATFWKDTESLWLPKGKAYLMAIRDLNDGAILGHVKTNFSQPLVDGELPDPVLSDFATFLATYGSLAEYFEVDNAPGVFNYAKAVDLAVAKAFLRLRPRVVPTMKLVSTGWSYQPTAGIPIGWEADPVQRNEVEKLCDLTSGHVYPRGPSTYALAHNLDVYGPVHDGLPREMLVSETGSSSQEVDGIGYAANQPHAALVDRTLRAQIGFADHIIQHTAFLPDYGLFVGGFDWNSHNPTATTVAPLGNGEDSRVRIFRRLALAYATHGAPLHFNYTNAPDLKGKPVYFRAVDTAALGISPTGGSSNKILLNFVNFDHEPVTLQVDVEMPTIGKYYGRRFGRGDVYSDAESNLFDLSASPDLSFNETLQGGDAVQYILSR
ncbi:MAG: hypothetical protein NVS3B20_05450 [Polyangiales bacterium]